MSIESRLAAKERAKKARRNAVLKKVGPVLFIAVAALLIWGIYALSKDINEINYSKGLTKDGKIKGYNAKDCLTGFPDLNAIDIALEEPTEEEIGEKTETIMKALISSKESAEKTEDAADTDGTKEEKKDETPVDYDALLTDAWVEEYASTYLGEEFEHTAEGFKKAMTTLVRSTKRTEAEGKIDEYLDQAITVKTYPWKFTRNLRKLIPDAEEKQNRSYYEALGLSFDFDEFIKSRYGSYTSYRKQVKANAKEQAKNALIWLAVGDELGVTANEADVKAWKVLDLDESATDAEKEAYWDMAVEEYGIPYIMLDYRVDMAHKALYNKLLGEE